MNENLLPPVLLNLAATPTAVNAAYYVARLIGHRSVLRDGGREHTISGLLHDAPIDVAKIAREAIGQIEADAQTDISALPQRTAWQYVKQLETFVLQNSADSSEANLARGRNLLNELRVG